MHADAPVDQKHIQQFLSANCFGDFLTRTGLDLETRELLTLTMLVTLGDCAPQVKGHIDANIRVGNTKDVLIDLVTQLIPFIGYPRALNALAALNETTNNQK